MTPEIRGIRDGHTERIHSSSKYTGSNGERDGVESLASTIPLGSTSLPETMPIEESDAMDDLEDELNKLAIAGKTNLGASVGASLFSSESDQQSQNLKNKE